MHLYIPSYEIVHINSVDAAIDHLVPGSVSDGVYTLTPLRVYKLKQARYTIVRLLVLLYMFIPDRYCSRRTAVRVRSTWKTKVPPTSACDLSVTDVQCTAVQSVQQCKLRHSLDGVYKLTRYVYLRARLYDITVFPSESAFDDRIKRTVYVLLLSFVYTYDTYNMYCCCNAHYNIHTWKMENAPLRTNEYWCRVLYTLYYSSIPSRWFLDIGQKANTERCVYMIGMC